MTCRRTSEPALGTKSAHVPALFLFALGCSQLTSFDLSRVEEKSDALCSDREDNDADGLTDCQDWKCLGTKTCCNLPAVVLEEDFTRAPCADRACASIIDQCDTACATQHTVCTKACPADDAECRSDCATKKEQCLSECAACKPDTQLWQIWGSPEPKICEGGLSPHKVNCYPVGVVSRAAFALRPGLSIAVGMHGRPETTGHLDVGVTLQPLVEGADDACAPIEPLIHLFHVHQVRTTRGSHFKAHFRQLEIGSSIEVVDTARHEIRIFIGEDRLVHYVLDNLEFARSPDSAPLAGDLQVHLALSGKGLGMHFNDVQVSSDTQCDRPGEWHKSERFLALGTRENGYSWDNHSLFSPTVLRHENGRLDLYYLGCPKGPRGCDTFRLGVGLATASRPRANFHRVSEDRPLFFVDDFDYPLSPTQIPDLALLRDEHRKLWYLTVELDSKPVIRPITTDNGLEFREQGTPDPVLSPGQNGAWDDEGVCCASAVAKGAEVYLWYAGKSSADHLWRIGVAASRDGVHFTKAPENPVLSEGALDDHDGNGVTEPDVVWDESRGMFRMWYAAESLTGTSSIAYALSPGGVAWFKYPGNPVVTPDGPENLSIDKLGQPAILRRDGRLHMLLEGRSEPPQNRVLYSLENVGSSFVSEEELLP